MSSGDQLLDAIYEAPGDLSARAVYADWLLERGDPRGELISLQLHTPRTAAQDQREHELIEQYGEAWQGRLSEITTWAEFETGFLARCGLRTIPAWAVGRREWATVTHLEVAEDHDLDLGPLITQAAMKSLDSIRIAAPALQILLGTKRGTHVRRMTVDGPVDSTMWAAIIASRMFDQLRTLDVRGRLADPTSIFESTRFDEVSFTNVGWKVVCVRGDDDRLSAVTIHADEERWGRAPQAEALSNFFKSLPPDVLSMLALPETVQIRDVKPALASQPRIVVGLG